MRVIGVTTTLPKDEMLAQGPDAVKPAIADISVADLTGLKRAAQRGAGDETAAPSSPERAASGEAAGPSDNVRP
jgi:hypothetical protein